MSTKLTVLLALLLFLFMSGKTQEIKNNVLIISTIHGAHKTNPNYSYEALFAFIEKYNPDIIGVEIRKEDTDSGVPYLRRNYPFEMYECLTKYRTKKVMGFDWLGDDLAGKAIPQNYWQEKSPVKLLQQKLETDSILLQKLSVLDIVAEERNKLALHATLPELNDGRYDMLNRIYYTQLKHLLNHTAYKPLTDFYQKRDEQIAHNILAIIRNNKGKKMIFLMGADHRDYTFRKVSEEFGETIQLNHF